MDTKYLTYILAIAKHKNMTKAAEELYVSQSSLSQYLSKLEQELKTPLFFRARGELVLTPAGQLYADAAREVLQIKKQLYKDIAGLENKGHLMVGATSQFALRALSDIIPRFKAQYPEISIEVTDGSFSSISRLLIEEQIDLGIMAASQLAPFENQCTILRNEEILLALPSVHPYCSENPDGPIPVKDFVELFGGENFLLSQKDSSLRTVSDRLFAKYRFRPNAICEVNNIRATQTMVSKNAGIAFIAESCMEDSNSIKYYSLEPRLYRYNLLVHRQNWVMNEAEQVFCSCIKDYFSAGQPDSPVN